MAFKPVINLRWPVGGLVERFAYQNQPPYTTPACRNVRPDCTLEARERGGSRPGLGKAFTTLSADGSDDGGPIGDVAAARSDTRADPVGSPVRMLSSVSIVQSTGLTYWHEGFPYATFDRSEYGYGQLTVTPWSKAAWLDTVYTPKYWSPGYAAITQGLSLGGAVRDALDIDVTKPYSAAIFIAPFQGAHWGDYFLHVGLYDSSPNANTNGLTAKLGLTYQYDDLDNLPNWTDTYSVSMWEYRIGNYISHGSDKHFPSTGPAQAGWFEVVVNGTTVNAYWLGRQILSTTVADTFLGSRIGFSIQYKGAPHGIGANGMCLVDSMRIEYRQPTVSISGDDAREILVASASGKLYREVSLGRVQEVETDLRLSQDRLIHAVDRLQKLYIADNGLIVEGDDGAANTTYASEDNSYILESPTVNGLGGWNALGIHPGDIISISNSTGVIHDGRWPIITVEDDSIEVQEDTNLPFNSQGTCSFRIEYLAKVYDPALGTLEIWETDTTGTNPENTVPSGCPLIARYRDRMVLAGAPTAPHAWYMSAQGDPYNWDYAKYAASGGGDLTTAVAGVVCDAGDVGAPITALIPHSDDYLLFGCAQSLWKLVGDPAVGGMIQNLSRTVGIVSMGAWCWGPAGELIFLSRDGLYVLAPGASSYPQSLSRERLPRRLLNIDIANQTILMAYDVRYRGVHIYLTTKEPEQTEHFWFDWETGSFWPALLHNLHEPTAAINYIGGTIDESGVLLGGRDGYIRRYADAYEQDDGKPIESYVYYGPLSLGGGDILNGMLIELSGAPADGSGKIQWKILAGETAEEAFNADAAESGTWEAGLNYAARPRVGGNSAFVVLSAQEENAAWAIERMTARRRQAGKQRLL